MLDKLPPLNQRRLDYKIKEVYGDRYADWYDLACSMRLEGKTYNDIIERFATLGVRVSLFTISNWLATRRRELEAAELDTAA